MKNICFYKITSQSFSVNLWKWLQKGHLEGTERKSIFFVCEHCIGRILLLIVGIEQMMEADLVFAEQQVENSKQGITWCACKTGKEFWKLNKEEFGQ